MKLAVFFRGCSFVVLGCGMLLAHPATAAEPAKAEPAKAPARAVHKVQTERLKVEVTLKGVLESNRMSEVAISLEEAGTSLLVKKAVEHGASVKKGDTLIWLDLEKIERAIRDLETDSRLAELAIRLAEEELPILEKNTPLDLVAAERAKTRSDEDLKKWIDVDRGTMEKQAEHNLKQSRQSLEYQKEELKQLEKMYKANDLTEETEEIILKRQRNQVASAEFYLQLAELSRERTLKIDVPRKDQDVRETAVKQALALDRAKATLPLTLNQKKLALDKLKYDRTKTAERLANLKKDRAAMTIKAAADGVVYYGKFTRGQWSGSAAAAAKLQRGGSILPEEVVMTIVDPRGLFMRATVEEADVHHFHPGLPGKVVVAARPNYKLTEKVAEVSSLPIAPGSFEVRIPISTVPLDDQPLLPSMACTAKFVPYVNEKALTVPVATVLDDETGDDAKCVYVLGKDGKPEKRTVTVGKKTDKKAEILTGLREGEQVLLEKPTDGGLATAQATEAAAPAGKDIAR